MDKYWSIHLSMKSTKMPIYQYRREDTGEIIEMQMSIARMSRRQRKDGRIRLKDGIYAQRIYQSLPHNLDTAGCWPQYSDSMGINPNQTEEAMTADREMGVPSEYDKRGRIIFRDRAHRKKFCEAHQFYDKDGGYADPQRGGRN